MSQTILLRIVLLAALLSPGVVFAQGDRPSCAIMKNLDLKPLLGTDHDAPVPFGQESCRAESNSPGRLVVLAVIEQSPAELKAWLASIRKINATHRAKEVAIVPEPALGADAFSVRDRGDLREIEFYASKGSRAVVVKGAWASGAPIGDSGVRQFRQLMRSALDKVP